MTGTFTDAAGGAGRATGTFAPTRFFVQDGNLLAEGVADLTLVGNLLCAIAGLLDGPSIDLGLLADVLNAILALINA